MLKCALISTIALGLAATALPALAQTTIIQEDGNQVSGIVVEGHRADVDVVSKTVSYRDLDVNTPEGARVLFHRIRSAADEVCEPEGGWSGELHGDVAHMGCAERAVTLALRQARIPALTYIYVSGRY